MFNVIKSVTRNGRSILLTALLALILVYLFSIVGFLFLKDDFILEVDRLPDSKAKGWAAPGVVAHPGTPHTNLGVCFVGFQSAFGGRGEGGFVLVLHRAGFGVGGGREGGTELQISTAGSQP